MMLEYKDWIKANGLPDVPRSMIAYQEYKKNYKPQNVEGQIPPKTPEKTPEPLTQGRQYLQTGPATEAKKPEPKFFENLLKPVNQAKEETKEMLKEAPSFLEQVQKPIDTAKYIATPNAMDTIEQYQARFPGYANYLDSTYGGGEKSAQKDTAAERREYEKMMRDQVPGAIMPQSDGGSPAPTVKPPQPQSEAVIKDSLKTQGLADDSGKIDWSSIEKAAKETGLGIIGIIQAAVAGRTAGMQNRALDYTNETILGREDVKKNAKQQMIDDNLQKLNYLDTQQKYDAQQKQLDRNYQMAIQNEQDALKRKELAQDYEIKKAALQNDKEKAANQLKVQFPAGGPLSYVQQTVGTGR